MWALAFSRVSVFLHLLVTPLVVAQYAALVWWGLPTRSHPSPAAWRPPDDEGGGATVLQWVCPHLLAGGGTLLSVGGMVALFVVGVACMRLPPLSQGERKAWRTAEEGPTNSGDVAPAAESGAPPGNMMWRFALSLGVLHLELVCAGLLGVTRRLLAGAFLFPLCFASMSGFFSRSPSPLLSVPLRV